ncbi:MAG: T9SS type A sorting domain-containing protein, partial [Bacteroidota bacterium]|nr:T9SS type A sorting domain-containing protein [Bacteroidota bacterium]
ASTRFWFLHNRPNQDLRVSIYIYSTMGNWVKTISQTINTSGSRSSDIEWDGAADTGARLTKGVYFYQVRVKAPDGQTAVKAGKLLLL